MFPQIDSYELKTKPFKYFFGTSSSRKENILSWIEWFEDSAPWELVETDFYEQYEFSLLHTDLPEKISHLSSDETLAQLTNTIESIFKVKLSDKVDVIAHKLVAGQTIRVHNDFIDKEGRETHRILFQLNRNYTKHSGGLLIFFEDPENDKWSDIIEPISASVQGFEISKNSHHAVSTVHDGERYTIVYSFRETSPKEII
ncbi:MULTISPECIES: cyclophane-containing peptide 2OG-Fe(II) oxygenase YhhC [unclassified Endozoicomonas]|uniref:cyclophane-containing peptide 2OG-Fe(II) oxygenase YhhC n=1 Tax=unclassified Endozoicomonas TaxID=2644528 RepID=UPI003BB7CD09